MKKPEIFFASPWTRYILTTVLGISVTFILDVSKAAPHATTIKNVARIVSDIIIRILNYELKVWWLLASMAILAVVSYILIRSANKDARKLFYLYYTSDEIAGWKWEWRWQKQPDGGYELRDLMPICPKCDTPLVTSSTTESESYVCPRCNYDAGPDIPNYTTVIILIYDNVKRRIKALRESIQK